MYKYIEDEKSKALYAMNRECLLRKYAPHIICSRNIIETMIKYVYAFYHLLKYIKNYMIYDKYVYTLKEYTPPVEYKSKNKPRVAVYTCIFGDYDTVKEPLYASSECDYFIITDQPVSKDSIWRKINSCDIQELAKISDPGMKNRWVKMHPFELFREYDYAIYIDGCVRVVADLYPIVLSMMDDEYFGIHEHPYRSNISLEAKAVMKMKKCHNQELMDEQLKYYEKQGFKKQVPLYEATMLVSKINNYKCKEIYELWWEQINKYVHRDQISLPYVIWKLRVGKENIKNLGDNILLNPRVFICKHNNKI